MRIVLYEFANFVPHIVINIILITILNGKQSAAIWKSSFSFWHFFVFYLQ